MSGLVGPTISVGTPSLTGNNTIEVPIVASGTGFNAYQAFQIHLRWDPTVFHFGSANNVGGIFDPSNKTHSVRTVVFSRSRGTGGVIYACSLVGQTSTLSTGLLTTITRVPQQAGCSTLHLLSYGPPDNDAQGTATNEPSDGAFQQNSVVSGSACYAGPATVTPTDTPTSTPVPALVNPVGGYTEVELHGTASASQPGWLTILLAVAGSVALLASIWWRSSRRPRN